MNKNVITENRESPTKVIMSNNINTVVSHYFKQGYLKLPSNINLIA